MGIVARRSAGKRGRSGIRSKSRPRGWSSKFLCSGSRNHAGTVRRTRVQCQGSGWLIQVTLRIRHRETPKISHLLAHFPFYSRMHSPCSVIESWINRLASVPFRSDCSSNWEYQRTHKTLNVLTGRCQQFGWSLVFAFAFLVSVPFFPLAHLLPRSLMPCRSFLPSDGGFAWENVLPGC